MTAIVLPLKPISLQVFGVDVTLVFGHAFVDQLKTEMLKHTRRVRLH